MLMSAFATSLARVSGVNEGHPHTQRFSLVGDKGPQLREAPTVQPSTLLLAGLHTVADIGQILHDDGSTRRNAIYDTAGNDVVAITTEASLFATEDLQSASGRFSPFSLALSLLSEDTGFDVFPTSFAKELPFAGDGGAVDPKVNPNCYRVWSHNGSNGFDDDVQEESSVPVNKIGCTCGAFNGPQKHVWEMKRDRDFARGCREPGRCGLPIHLKCVDVVSRRASGRMRARCLAASFPASEHRLDRFRGLNASLNMQIAHKVWEFVFQTAISKMMQPDAVLFVGAPSSSANRVKRLGELPQRFEQNRCLLWRRIQG
jgi:hypothetical protein